jgi:hypothetical protein
MSVRTMTAEFSDDRMAESAIGRLEVLGVPVRDISKALSEGDRIIVRASVEDRLVEKAALILNSAGSGGS